MTKFEDNISPYLSFVEGSAPSSPAATNFRLYYDSADHLLKWKNSAGTVATVPHELDYVQITSGVSLTATTEGTAHTVITGTSQAYTAIPTLIEVFCPRVTVVASAGAAVIVLLFDGATVIGRLGLMSTPSAANTIHTFKGEHRLTPTAATHQYIVKAYSSVTGSVFDCGAGGTGTELPAFLRITTA